SSRFIGSSAALALSIHTSAQDAHCEGTTLRGTCQAKKHIQQQTRAPRERISLRSAGSGPRTRSNEIKTTPPKPRTYHLTPELTQRRPPALCRGPCRVSFHSWFKSGPIICPPPGPTSSPQFVHQDWVGWIAAVLSRPVLCIAWHPAFHLQPPHTHLY